MKRYLYLPRRGHTALLLAGLLCCAVPVNAEQCVIGASSLTHQAEQIRVVTNVPALGAAVMIDGKVVASSVVGVRTVGGPPALINDLWHIGSITKSVTATLVARLVESGKLRFDATIQDLAPTLLSPNQPSYQKVTIAQLLTHHSGLGANPTDGEIAEFYGDSRQVTEQRRELAKRALARAPGAPPGSQFLYANDNYIVVGAIVETVTGESWEALVEHEVFKPLKIGSAGFGAPGHGLVTVAPLGHAMRTAEGVLTPVSGRESDNPAVVGPAGTIHMNIEDLASFASRHALGELEPDQYLSTGAYKRLHKSADGDAALGWFLQDWRGQHVLTSAGSNGSWFAMIVSVPERRAAIAVASNAAPELGAEMAVGELTSRLMRAALLGECDALDGTK